MASTTTQPPSAAPQAGWSWARIGGGGFVTGVDVADDGTKVFRTDTSGAYVFDDATGAFQQVLPANLDPARGAGCFEILVAPVESAILWALYDGDVLRSDDRGATWRVMRTGLTFQANGGKNRLRASHGDIDPADPDHLIFGDELGLHRTVDGGLTWSLLSDGDAGAPTPAAFDGNDDVPGYAGIVFNRDSPLDAEGRTTEVIGATAGRYFRSVDAGATWSDITSDTVAGTVPQQAQFLPTGEYVAAVGPSTGRDGVYVFIDGSWEQRREVQKPLIVADPTDPRRWSLTSNVDHGVRLSDDAGGSWTERTTGRTSLRSVDGIAWHDQDGGYLANAVAVDAVASRAWFAGGNAGVASVGLDELFERSADDEPLVLSAHGVGLDGLCVNVVLANPGSSRLHVATWDETYGRLDRANQRYPDILGGETLGNGFGASWGLDASTEDPTAIAIVASWDDDDLEHSGYSLDDGATWARFETMPFDRAARSASVAYGALDNLIVVGGANQGVYYTLDRGISWEPVTVGGVTYDRSGGFEAVHNSQFLNRRVVCSDAAASGVFYWLNTDRITTDNRGLWRTADGGVTWTLEHPGPPGGSAPPLWHFNVKVVSPVGGHVWMTTGGQGGDGPGRPGLFRSLDGGATLDAVPGMGAVQSFGFGAPAAEGGYPVCFVEGYLDEVYGVYMAADADAPSPAWITLATGFPLGQSQGCRDIAGDPDVPGRMWSARACAGVLFGEFGELLA